MIPLTGRIALAALMLLTLSAATVFAAPIGYAVRVEGLNYDGYLYRIDLATGEAVNLGLVGLYNIEGMAFVGDTLFGIGGEIHELWDITTPPGTKVGDTGPRYGSDAGLSYDPTSGKLYNIQRNGLSTWLYEINMVTGAATLIGSDTRGRPDSLAIDTDGTAYAFDAIRDTLYTVNLSTGALDFVGPLRVDLMAEAGLSFDASGELWALTDDGEIYTVDKMTGAASLVTTTLSGFEALAIPEPATFLMLTLGSALLLIKRV
jgi:outer membrane protein assembly factor BamB